MTPYGYHNSEINHSNGDERRNAREAIRQAKLVQRQRVDEVAPTEASGIAERPGLVHRLYTSASRFGPRSYLRHFRAHSH